MASAIMPVIKPKRFPLLALSLLILLFWDLGAQDLTNSSMKTFMIYKFAQHIEETEEITHDPLELDKYVEHWASRQEVLS